MSTEPDDVAPDDAPLDDPFEIDTTVAHAARRYNYWLGGKDNFEADRATANACAGVQQRQPVGHRRRARSRYSAPGRRARP